MTTIFRAAPKLHSPAKYASNILYHTSLRPITWRGMVQLRKNVYFIMNNNNNTKRKKKKKKKENLSLHHWSDKYSLSRRSFRDVDWSSKNAKPIKSALFQPAAYTSRPYWLPCIVKCHGLTALWDSGHFSNYSVHPMHLDILPPKLRIYRSKRSKNSIKSHRAAIASSDRRVT